MKVNVIDIKGQDTGRTIELPDEMFGIEPNEHAMYLAAKQFLAHGRQGTAKSKERWEISLSTRKIKRQKGTGTARAGSLKSPLFRGGGRVFGPQPRDYNIKLNKKLKSLARASALSSKAADGNVIVIEDFSFDKPHTKSYVDILKSLNIGSKRSLHVIRDYDKTMLLSMRNVQRAELAVVNDLNTYQILKAGKLIFSEGAIDKIRTLFV
ncbi:MAG TPA: 50S ribosomal protein L4 [Saprospirales bacterium]|nr:50S ribosomal protein L4 [Saprospirales bacterium]HAY70453.1 50S ribosomal protein L4 [Saprospirales bacterium]HRQ28474.1 50S ribosomal protein L4 [Saprospiraceae bacterium]